MKKNSRTKYRSDFSGDYHFDYKDPNSLMRFVTDGGKITPARLSKLSIALQKRASVAVKKARSLGLLPTGMQAYDKGNRTESISPAPFDI